MLPNKDTFCSSPWLHLRIEYSGKLVPCRWYDRQYARDTGNEFTLQKMGLMEYFNSAPMVELRDNLLNDVKPRGCATCYYEDSFEKLSGRKRQLFRSKLDNAATFDDMLTQSSHYPMFKFSQDNNGKTDSYPYDLQIDLDDTCNSACIMCHPTASSKLNADYKKLSQISPSLFKYQPRVQSWSSDPAMLAKFIEDLKALPHIEYIHFIGGETLYVESFFTICEALIDAGLAKDIIMGTTTNGTIYSERLANIISKFRAVHLGLSIESVNSLNDYVRFPSAVEDVTGVYAKFLKLRDTNPSLSIQLRITPNVFSILYLDEMIQYMCDNKVTAESCNILRTPVALRIEALPNNLRLLAIDKLIAVAEKNGLMRVPTFADVRNSEKTQEVISTVVYSYIDFLTNMSPPDDVEEQRHELVEFISGFETLRENSILDYAPEYSNFLQSYGYIRPT